MTPPSPHLAAVAAAALCAAAGPAQAPAGSAAALLRSDDPVERAWGAHRAVADGGESLTPLILRRLAETADRDGEAEQLARRALVGALVELDATVPEPELGRLAEHSVTAALILAAKRPADHEAMLLAQLERHLSDPAWAAVLDLLLSTRSGGLGPVLLRELTLTTTLRVTEPGHHGVGGGFRSRTGDGSFTTPAEFPPLVVHLLSLRRGDVLLADGPRPVALRRIVVAPGQTRGFGEVGEPLERDQVRLEFLAALAGGELPAPLAAQRTVAHEWHGAAALRDAAEQARREVGAALLVLGERLVARRAIERAAQAELDPVVRVVAVDGRADPLAALPDLPVHGAHLQIGGIAWYTDVEEARTAAQRLGRPLLLHFGENPG